MARLLFLLFGLPIMCILVSETVDSRYAGITVCLACWIVMALVFSSFKNNR